MDKSQETATTKQSSTTTTLNSSSNGNQHSINGNSSTTPTNNDSGTSSVCKSIGELSPPTISTSTSSMTPQNHHDNINLGCGSSTRLSSLTTATRTATSLLPSSSSSRLNNSLKNSSIISSTFSSPLSQSATAIAEGVATTTAVKSLPRSASAALPNFYSTQPPLPAPGSSTSNSTINGGGQTSITHVGTPLPATLQHHANLANLINLNINTTTGGNFGVTVDPSISVENLKKIIAKKLKVSKDRICLLHREKELQDGALKENNLMDGSRIILIPNVETGLLAQRPENTVMQALESLNDSQVNDFLSGKTPLNLSMRLGDHMMLIQLQLSTVNPANNPNALHHHAGHGVNCTSRLRSSQRTSRSASTSSTNGHHHSHHHHHHYHHHSNTNAAVTSTTSNRVTAPSSVTTTNPNQAEQSTPSSTSTTSALAQAPARKLDLINQRNVAIKTISNTNDNQMTSSNSINSSSLPSSSSTLGSTTEVQTSSNYSTPQKNTFKHSFGTILSHSEYESLHKIVQSITGPLPSRSITTRNLSSLTTNGATTSAAASSFHSVTPPNNDATLLEQSPIKSLSNLVSSPIKTTAIKNIPINSSHSSSSSTNAQALNNSPLASSSSSSSSLTSCQPDPIAAKLTSCLCTRLNSGSSHLSAKQCIEASCLSRQEPNGLPTQHPLQQLQQRNVMITSTPNIKALASSSSSGNQANLHKTVNNPITRSKAHRHHHHHHHHHHHYHHPSSNPSTAGSSSVNPPSLRLSNLSCPASTPNGPSSAIASSILNKSQNISASRFSLNSNDSGFGSDDSLQTSVNASSSSSSSLPLSSSSSSGVSVAATSATTSPPTPMDFEDSSNVTMTTDTRTLAEASRNLTQTLRKLSKEVFTNKIDLSCNEDTGARRGSSVGTGGGAVGSGAVIESMKNHGKGIYSGTFSGTLNPALQDRYGRPKRDISTVIHILNDLLSATPQYSRGARISLETPASSASSSTNTTNISMDPANVLQRNKQVPSKHPSHSCVKCNKAATAQSPNHDNVDGQAQKPSYGECNWRNASKSSHSRPSTYSCCPDLPINPSGSSTSNQPASSSGPNSSSTPASSATNGLDRNVCSCRYLFQESGDLEREHTCQKCLNDMDNIKTKSKMNQIRLVMQQSKQRREARKLKGLPYGARLLNGGPVVTTANSSIDLSSNDAEMMPTSSNNSANTASKPTLNNATAATTLSTTTTAAATTEVSPNHIVEEVDTAA